MSVVCIVLNNNFGVVLLVVRAVIQFINNEMVFEKTSLLRPIKMRRNRQGSHRKG